MVSVLGLLRFLELVGRRSASSAASVIASRTASVVAFLLLTDSTVSGNVITQGPSHVSVEPI